jgi:hypothetical protein
MTRGLEFRLPDVQSKIPRFLADVEVGRRSSQVVELSNYLIVVNFDVSRAHVETEFPLDHQEVSSC